MVQGLADYAQKIHVLCMPGSTRPFAYFWLDGARILPTALIEYINFFAK